MDRTDLLLWLALQEDLGHGDVTTEAVVDPAKSGQAFVFGREPFVLSGSKPFRKVFGLIDPAVEITSFFQDGERIEANAQVFRLNGALQVLLTGERLALNLLQRLSGVATLTRQMVEAMVGSSCRLLDTRKTTPLWRALEKEAVRHGGGVNHRFGLYDGVLIKDNHIAAVGGVREAVQKARQRVSHTLKVEVEVENLQDLQIALEAGADVILLDNFSLEDLKTAVAVTAGHCLLEASGGVTLDRIRAIAETGVDFISCGALTHSARAIDVSMEFADQSV
jgi:nicotinate-nucleotide pyrophosphorylase (carboxylating)